MISVFGAFIFIKKIEIKKEHDVAKMHFSSKKGNHGVMNFVRIDLEKDMFLSMIEEMKKKAEKWGWQERKKEQ